MNPRAATWTVKDGSGNTSTCQSKVIVNEKFTVTVPDGWALGSGCVLNTVNKGYLPASYTLLISKPSGGKAPYTYKWSNGAISPFILVNPRSSTTYTLTARDANGCTPTVSRQINVVDVRCGNKMDKVMLCYQNKACTDQKDVAKYLLRGAYLVNCKVTSTVSSKSVNKAAVAVQEEDIRGSNLTMKAFPNPSTAFFKFAMNSNNVKDKIR